MLTLFHVLTVFITILFVLYADEQAFMWMLGRKALLSEKKLHFLHTAVSLGLAVLLITGGLLYARSADFYLSNPAFIIKMTAIAALIINTYVISRFSKVATLHSFAELTPSQKMPLYISGAVSVVGWVTAIVCGFLLGG